jgi:hypothetical protein
MLKICDLGSLNDSSLPLESLHNVDTYLKNRLFTYFTHFWKDQIEQSRYSGKLRAVVAYKLRIILYLRNTFMKYAMLNIAKQ